MWRDSINQRGLETSKQRKPRCCRGCAPKYFVQDIYCLYACVLPGTATQWKRAIIRRAAAFSRIRKTARHYRTGTLRTAWVEINDVSSNALCYAFKIPGACFSFQPRRATQMKRSPRYHVWYDIIGYFSTSKSRAHNATTGFLRTFYVRDTQTACYANKSCICIHVCNSRRPSTGAAKTPQGFHIFFSRPRRWVYANTIACMWMYVSVYNM